MASDGYFDSVFGDIGAWGRAVDATRKCDAGSPVAADKRLPPCVGHATQDPDERPGDYLEHNHRETGETYRILVDRYPDPTTADLVTLWKRGPRVVLSITAGGQTQDFYMPPARLVYLLREVAEQLAENTLIQ